jgi:hypothetical protein
MKVKDLVDLLLQENQESEVTFSMDVGCCGDSEILIFAEVDQVLEDSTFIRFRCPEFLNSCRKYGHHLELSRESKAFLERGLEDAKNGRISPLNLEEELTEHRKINTDNLPVLEALDRGEPVDHEQTQRFLNLLRSTPKLPDNSHKVIFEDDPYLRSFPRVLQYSLVAYDSEDKVLWSTPIPEKVFNVVKESEKDFDQYGDCFPIYQEDYILLQQELGIILPFNFWQIAEKTSIVLDKLLECRKPLVEHRNELVKRPFFLFRKSLKEKVALLDKEIEEVDLELNKQRRIYASSGVRWYLERSRN